MNYHKDNGLLNMIRRTDPMINSVRDSLLKIQRKTIRHLFIKKT